MQNKHFHRRLQHSTAPSDHRKGLLPKKLLLRYMLQGPRSKRIINCKQRYTTKQSITVCILAHCYIDTAAATRE